MSDTRWISQLRSWLNIISGVTVLEEKGLKRVQASESARTSLIVWLTTSSNRARYHKAQSRGLAPDWDTLVASFIVYISRVVCTVGTASACRAGLTDKSLELGVREDSRKKAVGDLGKVLDWAGERGPVLTSQGSIEKLMALATALCEGDCARRVYYARPVLRLLQTHVFRHPLYMLQLAGNPVGGLNRTPNGRSLISERVGEFWGLLLVAALREGAEGLAEVRRANGGGSSGGANRDTRGGT